MEQPITDDTAMAAKKKLPTLSFSSNRRFGIELEINAFDGRNRPESGKKVAGIDAVCKMVGKYCSTGAEVRDYEHTQGNECWVVKPDSSCGMEVVTPPMKGWKGLLEVCKVVEGLAREKQVKADGRCSVHVHIEVADLSNEQLATVLAYWIKCEPVFLDAMPRQRKRNRYCQSLGLNSRFDTANHLSPERLIEELGDVKYYSLNTNQMMRAKRNGGKRPTIECRIGEAEGCTDAFMIKNWTRLLIHFIEMTKGLPYPEPYEKGKDPVKNGLVWLDPQQVFGLLGFGIDPATHELSNGLRQTRDWFLARLVKNLSPQTQVGSWRYVAHGQLTKMLEAYKQEGVEITPERHLTPPDPETAIYCETTKY